MLLWPPAPVGSKVGEEDDVREAMMMDTSTYPVHVDAHLDPKLSRWQWLVKWLLVIPHYVVLAFLWLAFVVLSAVAFFAILFTGRYPRAIFDFNVGVLRWSWRVAFYAYGALGTDRYPPFTLAEAPDYPAHLTVDYPSRLSRGLVLVKWWLLALPHYLVVAFFLGGGLYLAGRSDESPWLWGGGLIGLLVLVGAVVLLVTGSYPRALFDLVLGMNRWVLRVAAYAALMTDDYPPFRLDQGEDDPGGGQLALREPVPPGTGDHSGLRTGVTGVGPHSTPRWSAGRVVALVCGSLLLLVSLGLGAGGATLAVADSVMRDDAGFVMSGDVPLATDSHALVSEVMEVNISGAASLVPDDVLGEAKVTATPDGDLPLFVGVAAAEDAAGYLVGVRHATVTGLEPDPAYETTGDGEPAVAPVDTDIWVASSSGHGPRTVVWPVEDGDWTIVVMNADGSPGVVADVAAGATAPLLEWLVPLLLSVAGTGLVFSVAILVLALRRPDPRRTRSR